MIINVVKSEETLTLSDNIVIYKQDMLQKRAYRIEELKKVSILTTDKGPLLDDVALALFFTDIVFVLPSEHSCYKKIYDSLSKTLQLNYEKVIKAMSCAENAEFIIWNK